MKTLITTILLVLSVQGAVAQQTIEDIRKAYASVKEYIGRMSDDFPGEHERPFHAFQRYSWSPLHGGYMSLF